MPDLSFWTGENHWAQASSRVARNRRKMFSDGIGHVAAPNSFSPSIFYSCRSETRLLQVAVHGQLK